MIYLKPHPSWSKVWEGEGFEISPIPLTLPLASNTAYCATAHTRDFDSCLSSRPDNGIQPPDVSNFHKQKKWDKAVIDAEFSHLFSQYSEPYHRVRLLAAAARTP